MLRIVGSLTAVFLLAALLVSGAASRPAEPAFRVAPESREVAIFYYPWYGTEARDGGWEHWQQHGHAPPFDIASNWFPARGAYSSSSSRVLRDQMREIASAGVDTVIVSWWGPGSNEAARLPTVMRAARREGLRVALHVEPYAGRTPAGLEGEIRSFAADGITDFYIYASSADADADWRTLNTELGNVRLFANTGLPGKAAEGRFAGMYTYDVLMFDGTSFRRTCASARSLGLVCAPSVGPGYDATRATGDARVRGRKGGETYDRMWRCAVRADADIVTITSYNEWHEGTQIEPAKAVGAPYRSYDGAYGLVGHAAETAYLVRTSEWAARYRESPRHPSARQPDATPAARS